MGYILLFVVLLALLIVTYVLFNKDVLSPSVLTCGVYFATLLAAIFGLITWNDVKNLSLDSICIIICGVVFTVLGGIASKALHKKNNKNISNNFFCEFKQSKVINYLVIILMIITIALTYRDVYNVNIHYGHTPISLSKMLEFYRLKTLLFNSEAIKSGVGLSFITNQLQKVCFLMCVFNIYILISNIKNGKKFKENWQYYIIIILAFCLSLLTSSRSTMFHFISTIAFFWILLKNNKKDKLEKNIILKYVFAFIIILITFFLLTNIVGRKSNMKFYDYITFYAGSPIPSLNEGLNQGIIANASTNGSRTFYGVQYSLARLGIIDNYPISLRTGIVFGNYGGSNVYTSYSTYYSDFGIIGVMLFSFIFGFVLTHLYEKIKEKHNKFMLIIYAYYFYVLIDQFRGDLFYGLISISTLSYMILGYVIYIIYSKGFTLKKIRRK